MEYRRLGSLNISAVTFGAWAIGGWMWGGPDDKKAAEAIKASGSIVHVGPYDFARLLERAKEPLVVCAEGGVFSTNYQYLMSYRGLAFFTKSANPLRLPTNAEVIVAKKIWIPG